MFEFLLWVAEKLLGRHTIIGAENIDENRSSVFVCNHAGSYGPVAMMLYFPFSFRPWVLYNSMMPRLCRLQLQKDLFGSFPGFLKPVVRLLSTIIEPACLWVMRNVDAIPVFRGRHEIFRTFGLSAEVLANGCSIALFPENADMKQTLELQGFHTGFVHLARKYYRLTGRKLDFYPVYINRKLKAITIGKPVVFDPGVDFSEERHRVTVELEKTMQVFAQ